MELNLRTVLVILGGIVMLGILIDGFRRMRRARQEALKLDVKGDFQFPEEGFSSELPNGGARVIGERLPEELEEEVHNFRDQLDALPRMSALEEAEIKTEHALADDIQQSLHEERIYAGEPDFQHESYDDVNSTASEAELPVEAEIQNDTHSEFEPEFNSVSLSAEIDVATESKDYADEQLVPKAKPLNLDEQVPLLMDVEELGKEIEPQPKALENEALLSVENDLGEKGEEDQGGEQVEDHDQDHIELGLDDIAGIEASVSDISDLMPSPVADSTEHEDGRQQAEDMMAQAAYAPVKKPGLNAESLATRSVPSLVVVTHVVPHDEDGFCGEDILYLVNSCDLRHGEKDIFHRFEDEGGEGRVQFSMANSFNPGTFNPDTLLHERIHGVSLFMSLPGPDKAMDAFEAMTEMASVIARNLGGDVHDETHSIMALQTIEHNRQQVRDFVRKQKLTGKK